MTDDQILKRAIDKAEKNGWKFDEEWLNKCIADSSDDEILFNKDFAKAIWGEEDVCPLCGSDGIISMLKKYEFHLQQLAIVKEPLKYIERFL